MLSGTRKGYTFGKTGILAITFLASEAEGAIILTGRILTTFLQKEFDKSQFGDRIRI
jgi:hypothetical protein